MTCDKVVPMAYKNKKKFKMNFKEIIIKKLKPIKKFNSSLIVTFVGTLNSSNDLFPVLDCSNKLKENLDIFFLIVGSGEKFSKYKEIYSKNQNICFLGWRNELEINTILNISDVGILPYLNIDNYKNNIPNKFSEYLSRGLIIANSLDSGEIYELVKKYKIGFNYGHNSKILKKELLKLNKNIKNLSLKKKKSLKLFNNKFNSKNVYSSLIKFLEKNF